jgi:hypothetical protein
VGDVDVGEGVGGRRQGTLLGERDRLVDRGLGRPVALLDLLGVIRPRSVACLAKKVSGSCSR